MAVRLICTVSALRTGVLVGVLVGEGVQPAGVLVAVLVGDAVQPTGVLVAVGAAVRVGEAVHPKGVAVTVPSQVGVKVRKLRGGSVLVGRRVYVGDPWTRSPSPRVAVRPVPPSETAP